MKFAVMQVANGGFGRSEAEVYDNNFELAVAADQLGFDAVWVAEHHTTDYGMVPNILQYLVAVAVRTERIRLGTAVVVLPLHQPIRVAEEAAFVDMISRGRLDVGVGRGYQPGEFAAFGIPMPETRDRFNETVEFLRQAWAATEPFDFDGRFFSGQGIWTHPRPVQQPHPPLWFAAVSTETFEIAGRNGWQILTSPNFTPTSLVKEQAATYRATLAQHGFDPAAYEFPSQQMIYVGADADAAYREPRAACMGFFDNLGKLLPKDLGAVGSSYKQYTRTHEHLADLRYDYLWENSVIFGDRQRVIDRISFLRDEIGVTYLHGWFNFGNLDHSKAMASMRRFAEEVIPKFA